jgi:hypothetical protein
VLFDRDGTDVRSLGPEARVLLESERAGALRRLVIRADADGGLSHELLDDGQPRELDDEARRWMQSMIARGLERTGRPAASSYPAGEDLAAAFAGIEPVITRITAMEEEQATIEEEKGPLYEAADRLEAELEALDARRGRLLARQREVSAQRDAVARSDSPDESEIVRLDRAIDGVRSELEDVDAQKRPRLVELERVEGKLQPRIERWLAIEDRIVATDVEADPLFERCDESLTAEVRSIVARGLRATNVRSPATAQALARIDLGEAVREMLGGCCGYFIDEEAREIVLQVSEETARRELQRALDGSEATRRSDLGDADRRALDETVQRLARLVSTLRFTFEPGPAPDGSDPPP